MLSKIEKCILLYFDVNIINFQIKYVIRKKEWLVQKEFNESAIIGEGSNILLACLK